MRYADIWPRYAKYWDTMTIMPVRVSAFDAEANYAIAHKIIYQQISVKTGVPWPMIACLHRRESDGAFDTYLGNGQPLNRETTITPKNRGPFTGVQAFYNGSIDAIRVEGWGTIIDWRLEKQLYYMLLFNGIGSEAWGHPSSYIWGGTTVQVPGKWVRDGVWSNSTWDAQPGCAPLLKSISKFDQSVTFARETP